MLNKRPPDTLADLGRTARAYFYQRAQNLVDNDICAQSTTGSILLRTEAGTLITLTDGAFVVVSAGENGSLQLDYTASPDQQDELYQSA